MSLRFCENGEQIFYIVLSDDLTVVVFIEILIRRILFRKLATNVRS